VSEERLRQVSPEKLDRGEIIAIVGGVLLAIGVFLAWYHTSTSSAFADSNIDGHTGSLSAWDVHPILRWLLLAAAAAPLILAWIIVREHQLSWPRGQMTMVVAIAALGLIVYNGIIDRPGTVGISLRFGFFVAIVGAALMLVGSVMRQAETEIKRKPPGTI
jgi:archaellum biogenesis protein FlaJ (TadC family)